MTLDEVHQMLLDARSLAEFARGDNDEPGPTARRLWESLKKALGNPDLACAIVENGGPYQVVDECVHIGHRELERLKSQDADRSVPSAQLFAVIIDYDKHDGPSIDWYNNLDDAEAAFEKARARMAGLEPGRWCTLVSARRHATYERERIARSEDA